MKPEALLFMIAVFALNMGGFIYLAWKSGKED